MGLSSGLSNSFLLSTKLNKAKYREAIDSLKATQKAKEKCVELKFSYLGNIQDLHMELYPDASLGNIEENLQTKSMMGYFLCLSNDKSKISPLNWKSKVIDKVAPDITRPEVSEGGPAITNLIQGVAREEVDRHSLA